MATPTRIYSRRSLRPSRAEASVDLRQRRAWFDEQQQPPPAPTEAPAPDTAPGQQSGQQPATFTQEQLDKIIGERLKRAEEGWSKKSLETLGVDSFETLSKLVQGEKQRIEGEKGELQKIQERLAAAEKLAADSLARATKAEEEKLLERRDQQIEKALGEARSKKANDVLTLLTAKQPELVKAVMKADGTVDKEALTKLVEAAKKAYPEMFGGSGPGSPSNSGGHVPDPEDKKAREENFKRARRGN